MVELRREIGRIDTLVDGLGRQQNELDRRAQETRSNLDAIKKDSAAAGLRQRLSVRLEQFTREADGHGRQLVELNAKRLEARITLEEAIDKLNIDLTGQTRPGQRK